MYRRMDDLGRVREMLVDFAAIFLLIDAMSQRLTPDALRVPPRTTAIGALAFYASHANPHDYQPTNITFASIPSSTVRRPSHHSTADGEPGSTSSASAVDDDTTMGRANKACADTGTSSIASTVGQTTGPPGDHA